MGTMSGVGLNLHPLNHYSKNPHPHAPCCFNKSNNYNPPSSYLNFSSKFTRLGISSTRDCSFKKVVCKAVEDATETTPQLEGRILPLLFFIS